MPFVKQVPARRREQETPDEIEAVPASGGGEDLIEDIDDLLAVIGAWGACPPPPALCPADIDDSGAVDIDDLLAVIAGWGECP